RHMGSAGRSAGNDDAAGRDAIFPGMFGEMEDRRRQVLAPVGPHGFGGEAVIHRHPDETFARGPGAEMVLERVARPALVPHHEAPAMDEDDAGRGRAAFG